MESLLKRLKDKAPLEEYAKKYPNIVEDIKEQLQEEGIVGRLRFLTILDLMNLYKLDDIYKVYYLFKPIDL